MTYQISKILLERSGAVEENTQRNINYVCISDMNFCTFKMGDYRLSESGLILK